MHRVGRLLDIRLLWQELGHHQVLASGVHIIAPSGANSVGTTETEYPNGLAFSPDEKILYVAITRRDPGCLEEKEKHQMWTPP